MRSSVLTGVLALAACGDEPAPPPFVCDETTAGGTHKLFLEFEGVTLTKGPSDATTNTAAWLGGDTATIPAWRTFDANRAQRIEDVTCRVRAALYPFDVEVVTTRPTSGDYEMIVIGGRHLEVSLADGITGMTTSDCDNVNARDVGWVGEVARGVLLEHEYVANKAASLIGAHNALESGRGETNCMCHTGTGFGCLQLEPCTFANNVPVRTEERLCSGTETEVDQLDRLRERYGARP